MYCSIIKSLIDFLFSFIGLLLLSPIFLLVTLVLALSNSGQPFFIQKRPGKNGRPFMLIKFKTMNDKKDESGNLLCDFERLTPIGKFLRKSSLDELPQLLNVLKGDMSIVGPRPLLMEYLPLYSPEQARRHEVKPGITGWAQVNGRNAITWEDKFKYDVWYVDNCSFLLDIKILFMTFLKVITSEGVNLKSDVTAEKFTGMQK
ncbi:MAG: sugar transferase [Bacteroidales bacterium]|nr:sugar transferase [Bacteroidales bacterium]